MTKKELAEAWIALGDKTLAACERVFNAADYGDPTSEQYLVKLSGTALLCRTMSNFHAMRLLLEKNFIVEARTLARCCQENLFWIGGLVTKGPAFIKQMAEHNNSNTRKLGNDLIRQSGADDQTPAELNDQFLALMAELNAKPPGNRINQADEAIAAGLQSAYTIYRVLSGDAAHPSSAALNRHFDMSSGKLVITNQPGPCEEDEEIATFEYACGALISVCSCADTLFGEKHGDEMNKLGDEFRALSAASV